MGHKSAYISKRLDQVVKNKTFHLFEANISGAHQPRKREDSHSARPNIFIGREKDEKHVIDLLLSSDTKKNVTTVALVGHGGIGKTALAKSFQ